MLYKQPARAWQDLLLNTLAASYIADYCIKCTCHIQHVASELENCTRVQVTVFMYNSFCVSPINPKHCMHVHIPDNNGNHKCSSYMFKV